MDVVLGSPKVTVVLVTHNGARYIAEAIESILTQTYRHLELIVVDNESTDNTPAILTRFHDPRLRVIREQNVWLGFAYNRAVSLASGDFIAGMGHDDIATPERLATQVALMREENLDACFSWAEIVDDRGRPTDHFLRAVFNQMGRSSEELLERLQHGNFLLAPSAVVRRECYYRLARNVVLFGQSDCALWHQIVGRHRARVCEAPLVKFRVHDSNLSIWRFSNEYRQLEARTARHLATLPAFPEKKSARLALAQQLLLEAGRLMTSPESHFDAYLAANRAVNLDPGEPGGYKILAAVLSEMGHDEPAGIVAAIASAISPEILYPLPLLRPLWWHGMREHINLLATGLARHRQAAH